MEKFQRGDETADVWEPEKRMRLQSLKRAFCGSYEMPPETEENDQDQTADQEQTSEEKRMRLQSLQKRMRLQSLKVGSIIFIQFSGGKKQYQKNFRLMSDELLSNN